jgi:hypothetical protein
VSTIRVRCRLCLLSHVVRLMRLSVSGCSGGPIRTVTWATAGMKRLVVLTLPCAICGEAITHFGHDGGSHTFDHITPWSEAPSNDPSNLRHAHKSCNSRRGLGPSVA